MNIMKNYTIISLIAAALSLLISMASYTLGYVLLSIVILATIGATLVYEHKGMKECATRLTWIAILSIVLGGFLDRKTVANSIKKDGAYYVSAKLTSKKISTGSKGKKSYYLKFDEYRYKDGHVGYNSISVSSSEYSQAIEGSFYIIAEPVLIDNEEIVYDWNPTEVDVRSFESGRFVDSQGKESDELRKKYGSHDSGNWFTNNPFKSILIYLALLLAACFTSSMAVLAAMTAGALVTTFCNFGNSAMLLGGIMMFLFGTPFIFFRWEKRRIKEEIKRSGAYVTMGTYKQVTGKKSTTYHVEARLWDGNEIEREIEKPDPDFSEGPAIIAVPLGIEHTPIILSTSDIDSIKNTWPADSEGVFIEPGLIPENLESLRDSWRLRQKFTSK